MNPRGGDGLVIETAEAVVFGERPYSATHTIERSVERLSRKVQPCQPQVIGVAKLASPQAAGVERLQEFVVTQMSRGGDKRHKPIMADSRPRAAGDFPRRLRSADRQ